LIDINQKLAIVEFVDGDSLFKSSKARQLKQEKNEIENSLQNKIDSINIYTHNYQALSIDQILNDWLKTLIEYESAKARLQTINEKSEEFNKQFAKYAPLGATLTRIEREISVKEKAYLEILHHLGLAKLKQQNEEMMSNMKILDLPVLPIDAEPDKRKLFVIVISFFGFIFTLLGIIIFELMDRTIKSANRFSLLSGIPTTGISVIDKGNKEIDMQFLISKGLKTVIESIIELRNKSDNKHPIFIQFFSNRQLEGKSYLIQCISALLQNLGYKLLYLKFEDYINTNIQTITIPIKNIYNKNSYLEILEKNDEIDFVLIEIPALSNQIFNKSLCRSASISFFIADASRIWLTADTFLVEILKNNGLDNMQGILNKVHPDNMTDLLDEIPKKRSRLRRFIKYKLFKKFL